MTAEQRILFTEVCAFLRSFMRLPNAQGVTILRNAELAMREIIHNPREFVWQQAAFFVIEANK